MADHLQEMQSTSSDIKFAVREFYNSVGWKEIGEGLYQNARYEDLRPVSREYIRSCHLRVGRFLPENGHLILDAGSGPIQYPEYLEYSKGFNRRVCLDISLLALREARDRIGEHGLFVVGDIANLPFRTSAFDALISLHTVHHLPEDEHLSAFQEFTRVMMPDSRAVVVYSWGDKALLVKLTRWPIHWAMQALRLYQRLRSKEDGPRLPSGKELDNESEQLIRSAGTFTYKHGYDWIRRRLAFLPNLEVRVWRSMSTAMMRAFIHRPLFGKLILRVVFWFEERFPHLMGRIGQYPMVIFRKRLSQENR